MVNKSVNHQHSIFGHGPWCTNNYACAQTGGPLVNPVNKVVQDMFVLPTKVVRDVLAPARERRNPHEPLRRRTTFFAMSDCRRVHDAQATCRRTESSLRELAEFARVASFARFARFASFASFARFARGNGVINCSTEPPYHTRRGPG